MKDLTNGALYAMLTRNINPHDINNEDIMKRRQVIITLLITLFTLPAFTEAGQRIGAGVHYWRTV